MRSPIDVIEEQMKLIEKLPKTDIAQAMVVSPKFWDAIIKSTKINENIFRQITVIEILRCDGMLNEEMVTFKDKLAASYFVESVRQFGIKKAKELYKL